MDYGARYYDPVSGRFISADGVENNATGDDPFAYVADNPETMTDPSGNVHIDPQGDTSWTIPGGNQPTVVSHASSGEVQVVGTSPWTAPAGSNDTWNSWGNGWIYGSSSIWTGNSGSSSSSPDAGGIIGPVVVAPVVIMPQPGPAPQRIKQMSSRRSPKPASR